MASLPYQNRLSVNTAFDIDTGVEIDMTEDGAPNLRQLSGDDWIDFALEWDGLTIAELNILRAWIFTNRLANVSFELTDNNYTGKLTGGLSVLHHSPYTCSASSSLRGKLDA